MARLLVRVNRYIAYGSSCSSHYVVAASSYDGVYSEFAQELGKKGDAEAFIATSHATTMSSKIVDFYLGDEVRLMLSSWL